MRRFWINKDFFVDSDNGQSVLIQGDDFKHICVVCRQEVGSQFEVLPGDNQAYFVKIITKEKKQAMAEVMSQRSIAALPQPYIELCVSMPKFNKFDLILEKSVELGVHKVRPFFSDYSFITDPKKMGSKRLERFHEIIKSATQQSGRGKLMEIEPPCTLGELLKMFNQQADTVGLFSYEGESTQPLNCLLYTSPSPRDRG